MKNPSTFGIWGLLLLLLSLAGFVTKARAIEQRSIEATVKISVCGNNVAEGGEDCDEPDLREETCQTQGFAEGTLACEFDCSFDTSDCSGVFVPTATPTPTPTPTTAVAATSAPGPTATSAPAATATPAPAVVTIMELLALPEEVATFDIDGDGRIASHEVAEAIGLWVEEWRKVIEKGGVKIIFPTEEEEKGREVKKEKPKKLIEKILPWVRKEEPAEEEEEPPVAVEPAGQGILETLRFLVASRLGRKIEPETIPEPSAEEVLKSRLEKASEMESQKPTPAEEKKCDINQDQECNLVDFSVLLYYIDR